MNVIGFRTSQDVGARAGEQIVHLAVLSCGHIVRIGHGHVPLTLPCPEGCDVPCNQSLGTHVTWTCVKGTVGCTAPHPVE